MQIDVYETIINADWNKDNQLANSPRYITYYHVCVIRYGCARLRETHINKSKSRDVLRARGYRLGG